MEILIFDNDMNINNSTDIYETINLVLSEPLFINNLSNNYNWTNSNIDTILETIKDYLRNLEEIRV